MNSFIIKNNFHHAENITQQLLILIIQCCHITMNNKIIVKVCFYMSQGEFLTGFYQCNKGWLCTHIDVWQYSLCHTGFCIWTVLVGDFHMSQWPVLQWCCQAWTDRVRRHLWMARPAHCLTLRALHAPTRAPLARSHFLCLCRCV